MNEYQTAAAINTQTHCREWRFCARSTTWPSLNAQDPAIISEIPAPTPGDSRFTLVAGSYQSWQLPRHFYVASASGTCGRIKYSARCKRRTSIAALGRNSDSDCDSSTATLKKFQMSMKKCINILSQYFELKFVMTFTSNTLTLGTRIKLSWCFGILN